MNQLEIEVKIMRATGISDDSITRLVILKKKILTGIVSEQTLESKRLIFAKSLVDSGRLSDSLYINKKPPIKIGAK